MNRKTALLLFAIIAFMIGMAVATSQTSTDGKQHTPLMTNQPPS